MSHDPFEPDVDVHEASPEESGAVRTGVPGVDEVLDRVEALDELPVEDHVAVFERAHEQLRSALDEHGGPDPASHPD